MRPFNVATTDRTGGVEPLTPVSEKLAEVCPAVTEITVTTVPLSVMVSEPACVLESETVPVAA